MPDLLLELLSEEIPARMQARAADDLRRLVTDALVAQGFLYEGAVAFVTPRRLALHIAGLPARGQDLREERKGPRVGAPDAALSGFLKSTGLTKEQLTLQSDPKKGDSYVAVIERPGRPTPEVLAEIIPATIRSFPWPKSMRWGAASAQPGSLRWVRPLQSILCVFDTDIETPEIVPFEVDGLASGDVTRGHRFMAPSDIRVRRFEDYVAALEAAHVVLDPARRRDMIAHDARDLAFAQGYEVVEDEGLLDEVAGLVEWPVVLMGSFDASFLAIPPEAIRATIRANQKCFVLRGPDGALANRFVLTANIAAHDGGEAIVAGNERVVRARLSDARFFWESDLKVPLENRLEKLKSIKFHEKLGTQFERVERIAALARELAPIVGADPDLAARAARLAKADLVTEMVGEFPELQGLMGRYYAAAQGQDASVAAAIEEHYKPVGPSDRVPTDPVSVAVALADKLDTLVGFWAIGETPTGSKDPYALRRAALGVIRLVLENGLRLNLGDFLHQANREHSQTALLHPLAAAISDPASSENELGAGIVVPLKVELTTGVPEVDLIDRISLAGCRLFDFSGWPEYSSSSSDEIGRRDGVYVWLRSLSSFFHDRLKVYLRDRGARHDLIDAVLGAGTLSPRGRGQGEGVARSPDMAEPPHPDPLPPGERERVAPVQSGPGNDDLLMVVRRVEALGRLLETEDGQNLVAATKRAANILRIEEAKDGRTYEGAPDPAAFVLAEERALADALAWATGTASDALAREDVEGAMRVLAELRPAVDAFFEAVTVNDPDPALRANRLALLAGLRAATRAVADFARIEG